MRGHVSILMIRRSRVSNDGGHRPFPVMTASTLNCAPATISNYFFSSSGEALAPTPTPTLDIFNAHSIESLLIICGLQNRERMAMVTWGSVPRVGDVDIPE